jgi:hypothetical protein
MSSELRILLITTEPEDMPKPPYALELQAIRQEMKDGDAPFRAEYAFHATRRRVMEALESFRPEVVHFLCHGNPEGLMIEDDERASTLVTEAWLTDVFAAYPTVQLVVLNACKSAGLARALATSPRTAIRGAFGWPDLVTADNARKFVSPFYNRLALKNSTQNAFNWARLTMDERDAEHAELPLRDGADFHIIPPPLDPIGERRRALDERERQLNEWEARLIAQANNPILTPVTAAGGETDLDQREERLNQLEVRLKRLEKDLDQRKAKILLEEMKLKAWAEDLARGIVRPPLTPNPLAFIPSNIDLDGIDLATLGDVEIENLGGGANTNTESMSGQMRNGKQGFKLVDQPDGTRIAVYVFKNVRIARNASLKFSGTNAGALVALETMTIYGGITATSGGFVNDGSLNPLGGGDGGGFPARDTNASGGGSYGGRGGEGAAAPGGAPGAPGAIYGNPELIPLVGGSSGGAKNGGNGGGAIQLVAGKRLYISEHGYVSAGGLGGGKGFVTATTHGHGGGSGGSILLEAPIVEMAGVLAANGGGGGGGTYGASAAEDGIWSEMRAAGGYDPTSIAPGGAGSGGAEINGEDGRRGTDDKASGGGGGAGRIRINTSTGEATITGKVSPALSTACATQGKLVTTVSTDPTPDVV